MRFIQISVLVMLSSFLSCESETVDPELPELDGKTAIRIQNASSVVMQDIKVNTSGGEMD